ncbi:patatin-like phospholipase family protein [Acidiphilium sp. AL]|uniref:Patatin-like phospholipase family protein n=1 Tax=Acidiphilium iwatense TaxID=768198 RepID=A0ABS9DU24_9PROT|nr:MULTISPECIES: patatin-like phospholipase family protein [Acidiphilium]MCF3946228.1 patatin-like phospholipase family protein [Acidiphilium iwatense]MCU4158800.1 patatin-like phospholipase family protein [Acidiphilium sp. AL]
MADNYWADMPDRIGVALSGSGLLLGVHIGALKAVEQAGFIVAEIAGTSGGAVIAASYAAGLDIAAMEKLYLEADFHKLVPMRFYAIAMIRLLLTKGLVSPAPLEAWLRGHLGTTTFHATRMPCTIVASNVTAEASELWSTTVTPFAPLWQAVLASAAFPLVFPPVRLHGALLQDGGLYDDIPVDLLTESKRLAVMVGGKPRPLNGTPGLLGLLLRDIETLFLANNAHVLAGAERSGAVVAYAECADIPIFDTGITVATRQHLIEAGFAATAEALKVWSVPSA